jgi:hypothetical protein
MRDRPSVTGWRSSDGICPEYRAERVCEQSHATLDRGLVRLSIAQSPPRSIDDGYKPFLALARGGTSGW